MSRFTSEDWDYRIPEGLWNQALRNALAGRRGQAALREIERALLEMPEHALVEDAVAVAPGDESATGQVCFVGAYVAWKRIQAGEGDWDKVVAELAESMLDADEWETEALGCSVGLGRRLAWELAWLNDETWAGLTPERRWEQALAWVRARIKPQEGEVRATEATPGSGGGPIATA